MSDSSERAKQREKILSASKARTLASVLEPAADQYLWYFLEYFQPHFPKGRVHSFVLDAGSGSGEISLLLAQKGFRVEGLDCLPEVVEIAKQNIRHPNVHFQLGEASDLPFPPETFDFIICLGVFQTVEDPQKTLLEFHRVLKKNGILIIRTLNSLAPSPFRSVVLRRYHPFLFQKMCTSLSFCDIRLRGVYIFPPRLRFLTRLILRLKIHAILNLLFFPFFMFLSHSFYIEARKC